MRLEKLKMLKLIVSIIKKLVVLEKYLYHILRHGKFCA